MIIEIVVAIVLLLAAFVAWRVTSVARGARSRDEALLARLEPLVARFESGTAIAAEEIEALAAAPELRPMLYTMLAQYQRLDLFPAQYVSDQAQAESVLVYWLMHPNELQAAPEAIEPVATVAREFSGKPGVFYVFRYRMPAGHWAGSEWILGLAGPLFPDEPPYQRVAGGFSRAGDVIGKVEPSELVDWYVGLLRKKAGV